MISLMVNKKMHVGPLRRELRPGQLIEFEETTDVIRIDGAVLDAKTVISAGEAVRTLVRMAENKPDDPCVTIVGEQNNRPVKTEGKPGKAAPAVQVPSGAPVTETCCVLPILGCLSQAEQYLEKVLKVKEALWACKDNRQQDFMDAFSDLIPNLNVPELESRACEDVVPINRWLAERGFDIQLSSPKQSGSFAVASILDLMLRWLQNGTKTSITAPNGKQYPAARLRHGVVVSEDSRFHKWPVARINTKGGDRVCMTIIDRNPADLFLAVNDVSKVRAMSHALDGVIFPMIDLDVKPDISWLEGMKLGGYAIEQALQQTKFRMDDTGARVQSAAGMALTKGIGPRPMVIDRPFLLWIERDRLAVPMFAAVLAEDCWKAPKTL